MFGIDLHWLPHAQGALEVAKLVRKQHPDAKRYSWAVFIGNLHYHEELIQYPQVEPSAEGGLNGGSRCRRGVLQALEKGTPLDKVQNLTYWKDESGKLHFNELTYVSKTGPRPPGHRLQMDSQVGNKARDLNGFKPFKDWDRYPITCRVHGAGVLHPVCGLWAAPARP